MRKVMIKYSILNLQRLVNGFVYIVMLSGLFSNANAADGKLIATAGLIQVEGSGGGGIVPWATIAGYDSQDQTSLSAVSSTVHLDDYRLNVIGVTGSFYDKVELGIAQQRFDLKTLGGEIKQNIFSVKYKVYGDVVYSTFPQISVGAQHKKLLDSGVANLVNAKNSKSGTDFYVAMTKVHLGAVAGYNTVWNLTFRATKANEMGLLGFGGSANDDYEIMTEASVGVLFSRHIAVGVEYRQKPDNLNLKEDDWYDYFVSYIPNKNFNVTLAWTELGSIAGSEDQKGLYLSINGQLW